MCYSLSKYSKKHKVLKKSVKTAPLCTLLTHLPTFLVPDAVKKKFGRGGNGGTASPDINRCIESDDDEDDSDIPIGRNRKLKSRKCRDEFSEEYSSSDTEKSSSSSESNSCIIYKI